MQERLGMNEDKQIDVIITAYPDDNKAVIESNSGDAMIFLKARFKDTPVIKNPSITGDEVNTLLQDLKEKGLFYSFKTVKKLKK